MKFLFPQFFWALTALSIPLIIHLFNFRRHKTIHFSNTAFLQKVERNTRSVNRLRQLIIMLSRMLALAALVFAFARPILPVGNNNSMAPQAFVSIYIDNSYSMKADGQNGPLLNEARDYAASILKSLPTGVKVQILTNSFNSRNQRFYNKEVALELIDKVEASPAFRDFETLKNRLDASWQEVQTDDSTRLELFLISDMQKTAFAQLPNADWAKNWNFNLVPLRPLNQVDNLAIDSLWFQSPVFQPGFDQELNIRIKNYGEKAQENINLKLEINGQNYGMTNLDVPAQNSAVATLRFQPQKQGVFAGKISMPQGQPSFDNEFYFSFSTSKPAKVVSAGEQFNHSRYAQLFSDSLFSYQHAEFSNLNYAALPEQDLIILETSTAPSSGLMEALRKSLANGNNLFIVPDKNGIYIKDYLRALGIKPESEWFKDTLRAKEINYDDPYFRQVFASRPNNPDLPRVYQYLNLNNKGFMPLLELENNQLLLGHQNSGNGDVFVSAVPFTNAFSNLYRHPIIVPVLLNAALFQSNQQQVYLRAGAPDSYQFVEKSQSGDGVLKIVVDEQEIIPPQRYANGGFQLFAPPRELKPGNYPVRENDSLWAYFSLNTDARESDLSYLEIQDLRKNNRIAEGAVMEASLNGDLSQELKKRYQGITLWKWFLVAALIFLIVEIVLIKVWRS